MNAATSVDDVDSIVSKAKSDIANADKALADAIASAKSELAEAEKKAISNGAKKTLQDAAKDIENATSLDMVADEKSEALENAAAKEKELAEAKNSAVTDEAKSAIDTALANVDKATSVNAVNDAKSAGITNAAKADKALDDAKTEAIKALENAKANAKTEEEKNAIDESINNIRKATNLAAVKAASINFDKVVIKTASAQTIDYRSKVTIKATAADVPEGYKLAIYLGSQKVSEGDSKSVSYEYGELKSDLNYSVKVIDANGKVQKDSSGNEVSKDGGKITCNAGFFKKLIAFFKGLFGSLAKIEVKP